MNLPLVIYQQSDIKAIVRKRKNEVKLGEKTTLLNSTNELNLTNLLLENKSKFVLLGLPEDVGVRANFGRGGAYSAWQPSLNNILNIQSNYFFEGDELLVLGHIDFSDAMKKADALHLKNENDLIELRNIVAQIDEKVSAIIEQIVRCNKIPIVIGGGHNNSYGCLKGSSLALDLMHGINSINCDAHSDFRNLEGRHSGNGFSYAFKEKYLDKYAIVGLHENYNSNEILNQLKSNTKQFNFSTYEDIFIREKISFKAALQQAELFAKDKPVGLELDLDTVQNIPSSAKTSSGISALQARQFISYFSENLTIAYLHIAEGAPVLSHIKTDNKTGKLISYLVSDFIKSYKK